MRNEDVAVLFARGAQKGGTKHLFIEGDTIYSYGKHFPIAKRVAPGIARITTQGYSTTTARQKGSVRRALENEGWQLHETENVHENGSNLI